ncbi:MAG: response regulator [Calditrichaeota bacterium]|nr:response regulator [Calditrichota bacterium]
MHKHLVIIDEDSSLAHGIAQALRFEFEDISVLQNPLNARSLIQRFRPAVVISEIRFSTVDGTEMVCELNKSFPDSQVIVLSAYYSEKTLHDLKEAGVATILEKPVQMEKLRHELERRTQK